MPSSTFWDLSPEELRQRLDTLGEPSYRAGQLLTAAYGRLVGDYPRMTELPVTLRRKLAEEMPLVTPRVVTERTSADGSTNKVLLALEDGNTVETVLMNYDQTEVGRARSTVCVSTQVGCAMGCVFCATGQQGFLRNLSAGEITQQVLHFARLLQQDGRHVTNVVFMGMGEPLANYAATIRAVRMLSSPATFGLGARHITISTVGVVPAIRRLAHEGLQVGLAVSLHSPDDDLRRRLVPTARSSVREILAAADEHAAATGRRYSVEYALVDHANDDLALAGRLAALLRGRLCHVNLIPVNPTANPETRRSGRSRVVAFQRALSDAGITTTVRVEKGIDIAAGCGQLRGETEGRHVVIAEPLPVLSG